MFAERTGRIASFVLSDVATLILTVLLLWSSWWWCCGHRIPFFSFAHFCLPLQLSRVCPLPTLFKQLKHRWFAFAVAIRSSMLRVVNFGHWSGQWDEVLHSQHLGQTGLPSSDVKWFTWRLPDEPTLIGAVARIRDFISTFIQFIKASRVADFFSLSRSLAQTFLSSEHIFCSIMESIWLLSISLGRPTSFRVLPSRHLPKKPLA